MAENVKDQILGFLESRFPDVEIPDTEDIFSLGFVNSLFAMELVMFIEKNFGVTIPNEELRLDNFRTVKSMAELVERRMAPAAHTAEV
jgi:methoxymalonate biosynthesis acyl carrier protein